MTTSRAIIWTSTPTQDAENSGSAHVHAGAFWASTTDWDVTRGGEMRVCIYDAGDYYDSSCSKYASLAAAPDALIGGKAPSGSNDGAGASGGGGETSGLALSLAVIGGVALIVLVGTAAVRVSRRRQRRRWLGAADEAEALPDDAFIRPKNLYTRF